MAQILLERGTYAEDVKVQKGVYWGTQVRTLTGNVTLSKDSPTIQWFDAGGAARNVDLPAVTTADDGLMFIIYNDASGTGHDITIRDASAATVALLPAAATRQARRKAICFVANGIWYGLAVGG